MIVHGRVSVGTTAVPLNRSESDSTPGQSICIQNQSDVAVFLGNANVTLADYGHELAAYGVFWAELTAGEILYGIAPSTVTVNVIATGA